MTTLVVGLVSWSVSGFSWWCWTQRLRMSFSGAWGSSSEKRHAYGSWTVKVVGLLWIHENVTWMACAGLFSSSAHLWKNWLFSELLQRTVKYLSGQMPHKDEETHNHVHRFIIRPGRDDSVPLTYTGNESNIWSPGEPTVVFLNSYYTEHWKQTLKQIRHSPLSVLILA